MGLFDSITSVISNAANSVANNVGNTAASAINNTVGGIKPPSLSNLGTGLDQTVRGAGQLAGEGPNSNGLGTLLNVATQYATGGLLGYNASSGSFGEGVFTHAADEGLGAIDGRNVARDALATQQSALDADAAQQAQDLKNTQLLNQQAAETASTSAQANQAQVQSSSQAVLGSYAQGTSPDERNFLGL